MLQQMIDQICIEERLEDKDEDWLVCEIYNLRQAIRNHRDQKGDDRCWGDDEELYKILPEGYIPPERDTTVELKLCEQYIQCRRNPATQYVSPQRRIEELEQRVKELEEEIIEIHREARDLAWERDTRD